MGLEIAFFFSVESKRIAVWSRVLLFLIVNARCLDLSLGFWSSKAEHAAVKKVSGFLFFVWDRMEV